MKYQILKIPDRVVRLKALKYSYIYYKSYYKISNKINCQSFSKYLEKRFDLLFLWRGTKEGRDYWEEINDSL